jgi:hypothetical protein
VANGISQSKISHGFDAPEFASKITRPFVVRIAPLSLGKLGAPFFFLCPPKKVAAALLFFQEGTSAISPLHNQPPTPPPKFLTYLIPPALPSNHPPFIIIHQHLCIHTLHQQPSPSITTTPQHHTSSQWPAPSRPPVSPLVARLPVSSSPPRPLASPPRPPVVSRSLTATSLVPSLSVRSVATRSPLSS